MIAKLGVAPFFWSFLSSFLRRIPGVTIKSNISFVLDISEGPSVVEKLKKQGWKVFLDLKLHDIPNTVRESTKSVANLGADFLTIHITSTSDALIEASNTKGNTLQILGVSSALTSRAMSNSVSEEVNKEFKEAKECGVDGVICPASEISKTKEIFDLIVTPGIRLKNDDKNDQKNVATPNFAINEGAKYIVMGRSIRNNLDYIINDLEL